MGLFRFFSFVFGFALIPQMAFFANCLAEISDAEAPTCTDAFIRSYKDVAVEYKTIIVYAKAKQMAPNLAKAVMVCNRFEKGFPDTNCKAGNQFISSVNVIEACGKIRELAQSTGVQIPSDIPVPKPSDVTDETSVSILAANGIVAVVKNTVSLQKAIAAPKLIYFIDGKIFDFKEALANPAAVRCALSLSPSDELTPLRTGMIAKSSTIDRDYLSGFYTTRISFDGLGWAIDCSKKAVSNKAKDLNLGELKRAFGASLTFNYAP